MLEYNFFLMLIGPLIPHDLPVCCVVVFMYLYVYVFVYLCISVFVYFWPLIPHDVPGVVDRKHSNVQV